MKYLKIEHNGCGKMGIDYQSLIKRPKSIVRHAQFPWDPWSLGMIVALQKNAKLGDTDPANWKVKAIGSTCVLLQ